jgi:hypothetical protein
MADFQALLDEQKRTTEAVAKNQGKSALDGRSGAGKALLDQQKRTNEVLQNIVDSQNAMQVSSLMTTKALEEPKLEEPDKNDENDEGGVQTKSPFERIADKLTALQTSFEKPPWGQKIVESFEKGFGSIGRSISNLADKFKTVGKGVLAAGAAIIGYELLIRFFKSKFWAELSTKIIPALKAGLEYVKDVFFNITDFFGIESVGGQIATAIALLLGGKLLLSIVAKKLAMVLLKSTAGLFTQLGNIFKSPKGLDPMRKALVANKGALAKTTQAFKAIGKFLGKLFILPGVIIALFSGVSDAINVFKETGSMFEAIKEGLASTIANFIGFPLNFLKSVIGFVAGLFGFDNVKEQLAEFDFIDAIKGGIHAVFDFFERIGKTIKAFTLAAVDGLKALSPFDSKSPMEAFSERFAKEMGESGGSTPADKELSDAIKSGGSTTAEDRFAAINKIYGKEKDRNLNQSSSDNKGVNNSINVVNQNSTTNNSNSQVNYAKNLKSGQFLDQLASTPI